MDINSCYAASFFPHNLIIKIRENWRDSSLLPDGWSYDARWRTIINLDEKVELSQSDFYNR